MKGNKTPRLWLTRKIGYGSTGDVWEGSFDKSDTLFALKIVEVLCKSDVGRQQRLHNELEIYLLLEMAYQSGRLRDRITPRCFGAYEGNGVLLELCDGALKSWDDLHSSER